MGAFKDSLFIWPSIGYRSQLLLLPYWHEGTDYTWAKLDLQEGDNEIWVYYGSTTATDESDGDSVFEFFDDFEGTSLDTNKWVPYGNAPTVMEGTILLDPTDNTINAVAIRSKMSFTHNIEVVERRKFTDDHYVDIGLVTVASIIVSTWHGHEEDNIGYWFIMQSPVSAADPKDVSIMKRNSGEAELLAYVETSSPLSSINNDHITRVAYFSDGTLQYIHEPSTGEAGWNFTANDTTYCSDEKHLVLWQGEYENGQGGESYIDWVFVRKLSSSPPSISYSSEESGLWTIDGHTFTKRKKVTITSSQDLEGYQVQLDYSQWNESGIRIVQA